jgi:cation:H+ antiporter
VASADVGIGAILGAPFMLGTLAMFVTGVAVLYYGRRRPTGDMMLVNTQTLAHDIRYFFIAYGIAIGAAFLPPEPAWTRWVVAVVLIGMYVLYVRAHLAEDGDGEHDDIPSLRFGRLDPGGVRDTRVPRLRIVSVQVVAALGLIVLGAAFFVDAVEHISAAIGIDEVLLALVIAPIATELPEKFNSVLWVRQGKDTLSMGNITGAMVFQAAIPTVIALVLAGSSWAIAEGSYTAFASAAIAFLSAAAIFVPMARTGRLRGRNLLIGGLFYLAYLAIVIVVVLN